MRWPLITRKRHEALLAEASAAIRAEERESWRRVAHANAAAWRDELDSLKGQLAAERHAQGLPASVEGEGA